MAKKGITDVFRQKKTSPVTFTKQQILEGKKYSMRKDLLSILLIENKQYREKQINKLIADFMKGKVK